VNLLFVGDVFGSPGRSFLKERLPDLIAEYDSDIVIVNCENAAGGSGLTGSVADELFSCGADVLTSGNHIWAKKEIYALLDSDKRILRPLNYPPYVPGRGSGFFSSKTGQKVAVINVCGRVFSNQQLDCPFRIIDCEIAKYSSLTPYIIIDFHGEATSEKVAAGWYFDGRVSAVLGTHTHVQTADDTILP
jgi:metallophosphoesterase (TIGR00282 family)